MANEDGQIRDIPSKLSMGWAGYFNHMDKTLLPGNVITAPSKNVFIPSRDKIVIRAGSRTLAEPYTTLLKIGTTTGTFVVGETITGSVSGATAIIKEILTGSNLIYVYSIEGQFQALTDTITGQTSGATAPLDSIFASGPINGHYKKYVNKVGQALEIRSFIQDTPSRNQVYQALYNKAVYNPITFQYDYVQTWVDFLTEGGVNADQLPNINNGGSRIYFTEVYDNTAKNGRLVWTDGVDILSWSGSIGVVTGIAGTTLTIDTGLPGGLTLAQAGFDGGLGTNVVINGVNRTVTGGFGTSGNTIVVTDATGIVIGDIIADGVDFQPIIHGNGEVFHFAKTIKNHVIYGNFYSRQFWGSNALNVESSALKISTNSVQDDLIIANGNAYTGTTGKTLKFTISSLIPPPVRTFTPIVVGNQDVISFTGTHTGNNSDIYKVILSSVGPSYFYDIYLNGALVSAANTLATPYVANGISINVNYGAFPTTNAIGDTWILTIGGTDKYNYFVDNVLTGSGILASASTTFLGVTFSFAVPTGHALGDTWTVQLEPAVTKAWADLYFSVPVRKPAQGFTRFLPSNFWTMDIQEDVMYMADQRGGWSYLELVISPDALSETIDLQPLKQKNASKPIFPYMIGFLDNAIMYVTEDKKLDGISRKKFLELPQIGYLSDPVKLDFDRLTFIGGSMEYHDKKLWISSPNELTMMCYDNVRKYWQPPQEIPECAILSITLVWNSLTRSYVEKLIAHSNLRNQTNTLFIGTNDNGSAFAVKIRTGYLSYGNRWKSKNSNMTFVEGYMPSLFNIIYTVLSGINGAEGIYPHTVVPKFVRPPNGGPLGSGSLGVHELGSDTPLINEYFREIYPSTMQDFYFHALDLECHDLDQNWSVIGLGTNAVSSRSNNEQLKNSPILLN